MRVTIEIEHSSELEKLQALFKALQINEVNIMPDNDRSNTAPIRKGNKRLAPTALFGIWANNPRSLEQIRQNAWKRKITTNK